MEASTDKAADYNMSAAGDMLSWEGSGLGKFGEGGAVGYRGILYYRKGGTHAKVWEWK